MAAIPSYRAEMIGLSERDRTLLRSLLAASQARTGMRWDGDANQPQVYFIDIECQPGADFWQSLAGSAAREAAIVVSSAPPSEPARWLPKPLRSATLLSVLEQMALPATATPVPAAAARIRNPDDPLRLLDVLDDVAGSGARVVQSPHWPDIVLGSGNTHAMRTAPLDDYLAGFAVSTGVSHVGKYTGGPLDDELRIDLDALRWLALLHAPANEVEPRLPNSARVRLSALPPFGQLPHTLQHVRMAAWLVQHPAQPLELADMIGIDEDAVVRFLGACDALGLVQKVAAEPAARSEAAAPIRATAAVPTAAEPEQSEQPEKPAGTPVEAEVERADAPAAEAPAAEAVESGESLSVLERLRATREQNRARVAAAIRSVSGR